MKMVWKRIVDCVDIRIGQKVLIAPIGFGNSKLVSRCLRTVEAAGSNGGYMPGLGGLYPGNDLFPANFCRRQNAPPDLLRAVHTCLLQLKQKSRPMAGIANFGC